MPEGQRLSNLVKIENEKSLKLEQNPEETEPRVTRKRKIENNNHNFDEDSGESNSESEQESDESDEYRP